MTSIALERSCGSVEAAGRARAPCDARPSDKPRIASDDDALMRRLSRREGSLPDCEWTRPPGRCPDRANAGGGPTAFPRDGSASSMRPETTETQHKARTAPRAR